MKKIFSLLLTAVLMLNTAAVVFADSSKEVPEEIEKMTKNLETMSEIAKAYEEEKYEECIKLCDAVIASENPMMDAYKYKSYAGFSLDKNDLVYETLTAQLEKNPNNKNALYNAACAAALIGKSDESIAFLERLFDLDPTVKAQVKADEDFTSIRETDGFKKLMEIIVMVGGERVEFDVAPIIIDGRTLLPMRKVFECFGAEVSYDEATATAIAVKGDMKIEIPISSKTVKVNGSAVELDVPAMEMGGRTLVPVRFVAETLKAKVDWNEENEIVTILPAKEGQAVKAYADAEPVIDANSAILGIDGFFPNPYEFEVTEGMFMIVLKSSEAFEAFNALSDEDAVKYISKTEENNMSMVLGCDPVYVKVIYDNKMYYEYVIDYKDDADLYDENGNRVPTDITAVYYSNGMPVNVVKQDINNMTYVDFYLLPESERTSTEKNYVRVDDMNDTPKDTQKDTSEDVDLEMSLDDFLNAVPEDGEESVKYDARYMFEQLAVPGLIYSADSKLKNAFVNTPEVFFEKLYDEAWLKAVTVAIVDYLSDGDIEYANEHAAEMSDEVLKLAEEYNMGDIPVEGIETVKFDDNVYCMVITMKDPEHMLLCSYIAIVYDAQKKEFSYYMIEKSFADNYMLCTRDADGNHASIKTIENDYVSFLEAVEADVMK